MKKFLIITISLLACYFTAFSVTYPIPISYGKTQNGGSNRGKAPMRIPLDITFDNETGLLNISCGSTNNGQVYVTDINNTLVEYSDCLNTSLILSISSNYYYTITIETDTWNAVGEISNINF